MPSFSIFVVFELWDLNLVETANLPRCFYSYFVKEILERARKRIISRLTSAELRSDRSDSSATEQPQLLYHLRLSA